MFLRQWLTIYLKKFFIGKKKVIIHIQYFSQQLNWQVLVGIYI